MYAGGGGAGGAGGSVHIAAMQGNTACVRAIMDVSLDMYGSGKDSGKGSGNGKGSGSGSGSGSGKDEDKDMSDDWRRVDIDALDGNGQSAFVLALQGGHADTAQVCVT